MRSETSFVAKAGAASEYRIDAAAVDAPAAEAPVADSADAMDEDNAAETMAAAAEPAGQPATLASPEAMAEAPSENAADRGSESAEKAAEPAVSLSGDPLYDEVIAGSAAADKAPNRGIGAGVTEANPPLPLSSDELPKVDCKWGDWAKFTDCSKTCDGGTRWRVRVRSPQESGGGAPCLGSTHEVEDCNVQGCKTDCTWSNWKPWEPCSHTCGGGVMFRTRAVEVPNAWGGAKCKGDVIQEEACSMQPCPVNCEWVDWADWGACSHSCGGGSAHRERKKRHEAAFGGDPCVGDALETKSCNDFDCPVNCTWGPWGGWSACDKTCGGGKAARGRNKDTIQANGGADCKGLPEDVTVCNEESCPQDCEWGSWTSWSSCDKRCGGGKKHRTRKKFRLAVGAGLDCTGDSVFTDDCETQACPQAPVDCRWEDWNLWSVCSVSCGTGTRIRTRAKEVKTPDGKPCKGLGMQTGECDNEVGCPLSGVTLPPVRTADAVTAPVDGPGHGTSSTTTVAALAKSTVVKGLIDLKVSHPAEFVQDHSVLDAMHEGIAVLSYATWANTAVFLSSASSSSSSPSSFADDVASLVDLEGRALASEKVLSDASLPGAHHHRHHHRHKVAAAEAPSSATSGGRDASSTQAPSSWMSEAEGRARLRFSVMHAKDDVADELAAFSSEDVTSVLASALARHALLFNLEASRVTIESVRKQTDVTSTTASAEAVESTTGTTTPESTTRSQEAVVVRSAAVASTVPKDDNSDKSSGRRVVGTWALGLQACLVLHLVGSVVGILRS